MEMENSGFKRRRGRPQGHLLSDTTKNKIRVSRIGRIHSNETKNKISRSLSLYFKRRSPISESFESEYSGFPKEAVNWIRNNRYELDATDDIISNKKISYINQSEISYGNDIEKFYHLTTPEFLLLLKEELISRHMYEELLEFNSIMW
ncbi:MAG: NUMOD3 domain-containing DNA-binding protein [Dehalococcoidia bacterium]